MADWENGDKTYWKIADSFSIIDDMNAGKDVNSRCPNGLTPLHFAAMYSERAKVIETLIEYGANVHACDSVGRTPLHCAAGDNQTLEITKALLENGAKPNARAASGHTPLHHGAEFESINPDVIMLLLDNNADGKLKGADGKTPFQSAKGNPNLKGTKAYWALNDAQY